MAYKSKYTPTNPSKCQNIQLGMPIICRSLWERALAKWCDTNNHVLEWGVETVIVPYISRVDHKKHRYFVDFLIKFDNGQIFLIEVKPEQKTVMPVKSSTGPMTRRYKKDVIDYAVNYSKWEEAHLFAESKGWKFNVWTQKDLRALGLKVIG